MKYRILCILMLVALGTIPYLFHTPENHPSIVQMAVDSYTPIEYKVAVDPNTGLYYTEEHWGFALSCERFMEAYQKERK